MRLSSIQVGHSDSRRARRREWADLGLRYCPGSYELASVWLGPVSRRYPCSECGAYVQTYRTPRTFIDFYGEVIPQLWDIRLMAHHWERKAPIPLLRDPDQTG